MDPPKNVEPPTERDKRLLRIYGKIPSRGNLLHHQLEAKKSSDIGAVNTGSEHPVRRDISNPSCPVPSSSNVGDDANQDSRTEKTDELRSTTYLQQEMVDQEQGGPGEVKQENNM
ncbi:hypothetical protein NW755_014622 [Fusarium falciforme]|uniref:mRNA stability protein n=1 Tax=Fusarium falciforme TaxID=195108 RepID=A0A9W8QQG9_9HYPO|nr:hypothetical protein NW755_014622 [Fusarium falciforme]